MIPLVIASVRRHGWPDWAVGAVCLAALLLAVAGGFAAGTRCGPARTHTVVLCAGGIVCRDYWNGP